MIPEPNYNQKPTKTITIRWTVAAVTILAFFVINLATIHKFPVVWEDEVMQVDPAVNLASGLGWSSRAWFSQSAQEFWAANNPLYPALLSVWLKAFGFSITSVRSFNLFQFSVTTAILLSLANLLGMFRKVFPTVVFVVVLSCSGLMSFIYRSGRADMTTMLVCSMVTWAYVYARKTSSYWPLVLSSLLVVASGIQALPYLAALGATDLLVGNRFKKGLIAGGLGTAIGGIVLFFIMFSRHVLTAFIANTFVSNYSLLGTIAQKIVYNDNKAQKRFDAALQTFSPVTIWHSMTADASLMACLLVIVAISLVSLANRTLHLKSPSSVGLLLSLTIPLFMTAAGRYAPTANYYYWMSIAPLTICAVGAIEQAKKPRWGTVCAAILVMGSLAGLPNDIRLDERDDRSREYGAIASYLQRNVSKSATIYGDSAIYYAAKNLHYDMYTTNYGGGRGYPKVLEAPGISSLVIQPGDYEKIQAKIGGNWRRIPEILDTCQGIDPLFDIHHLHRCYQLSIYNRVH